MRRRRRKRAAGAANMPRASARKGTRSRSAPPPVKAVGKKAAPARPAKTAAARPNGSPRGVAAKPPAKASRGAAERRASEKTVQAGRTLPAAETSAEAFGDVLNKMQNKLEFGLKVLWDRDQAVREVENEDEDISRLKKEISGQKGPTYFARMQYGRLIDSALQSRSERYVADILEQLREVSVASRINKPIGDKMIMNAAFLIARDQETAFDGKVKSIASRFDKLTFKYTGPWPPYNFVNIRLKLERA